MGSAEGAGGPCQVRITAAFSADTFSSGDAAANPKDPRPRDFAPGDVLTLLCLPVLVGYQGRTPFRYRTGGGPADSRYVYLPDGCWVPVNWGKGRVRFL